VSRPARLASVHFYFDADVLGLAKIIADVRRDATYPGDPGGPVKGGRVRQPCTVTNPATDDEVWIQETARQGWLIITRDRRIQDNRAEIGAVRVSGARMITLAGRDAMNTFDQLELLMCNWRAIEGKLSEPGPFIYTATRTGGLNAVPLD
jgi:PIN domain-containing protein